MRGPGDQVLDTVMEEGAVTLFKYLSWGTVGLIALLAVWIVYLNRDSEVVSVNGRSALVVGAVGVLFTLLFSLKAEPITVSPFPAVFVFHRQTRQPRALRWP
jgi:hypothetical protein